MMINFENYFFNADPDIIIGHELISSVLEFYFKRAQQICTDVSFFSRLPADRAKKFNQVSLRFS